MINNLVKWQCEECLSIQVADKKERHTMSYCYCGRSYVDAEEYYMRSGGQARILKIYNENEQQEST